MKLIILDRDGVINVDSDAYIKTPDEWVAIPGSLEAIARLSQWGYRVVVASNQSGLGRGLFNMETLSDIHDKMMRQVVAAGGRIDAIFFCPHAPESECECRKPKSGMLKQIAKRYSLSLKNTPAVGDSLRDLQAASQEGALPILVLTGKGEQTLQTHALPEGTLVFPDLAAAAAHLCV